MAREAQATARRAREASARAARGTWVEAAGRAGLVARGISYGTVGVLAVLVAADAGGTATSRPGALAAIAGGPGGRLLLLTIGAGFAAYALWRVAQSLFDREREGTDPAGVGKRIGYAGIAVLYGFLAWTAFRIAAGDRARESENEQAKQVTAQVLSWPGGRWLVLLAGIAIVAAGVFNGYRAVARSYEDDWETARLGERARAWLGRVAAVGLGARAAVFGLIGLFVAHAAIDYDPRDAIGLDGALQTLAGQPYGRVLLGIVAAGLVAYGLFSLAEARYRRV